MTEVIMKFNAAKLRSLMAEHQYTNHVMSKMTGIAYSYISEFRNGKRQPSLKSVNKLIKVFDIEDYKIFFD